MKLQHQHDLKYTVEWVTMSADRRYLQTTRINIWNEQ